MSDDSGLRSRRWLCFALRRPAPYIDPLFAGTGHTAELIHKYFAASGAEQQPAAQNGVWTQWRTLEQIEGRAQREGQD